MKLQGLALPSSASKRAVGMGGLLLVVLLLAACATPQSRIEKDPTLYASFSSDAQEKIKHGKIDAGFTPQMVYFAWGAPDRKTESVAGKDKTEVWSYLGRREDFTGRYNYLTGRRIYTETVTYEKARVTFLNGKVSRFTP